MENNICPEIQNLSSTQFETQKLETQNPKLETFEMLTQIFDELPAEEEIKKPSLSLAMKLTYKLKAMETQLEIYRNWLEGEKNRLESHKRFIYSLLEPFMIDYFQQTNNKTLKLPNGFKLQLRKSPESIEIQDEQTAIEWAKENNPSLLNVKITIFKSRVMSHLKETGELPPGITVRQEKALSFSISSEKT